MAPDPEDEAPEISFHDDPGASPRATVPEDHREPVGDDIEGVPDEEDIDPADAKERLEEDPESVPNRRDVPDTPENSREARTEDD
ncbi:MAG TPA: hypothetical protein VFE07_08205 [Marmoricola sp.]|nr:hypothetical protein [Marmoricola sp.]